MTRKASIKETGEELSQAEWVRFDSAIAKVKAERSAAEPCEGGNIDAQPKDVCDRSDDRDHESERARCRKAP